MENYTDQEGCYPPRLKAEVDNILRDMHNSSHHTKAEFKIFYYYSLLPLLFFTNKMNDKLYYVDQS